MKRWHALHTLAIFYRDAYNNQLNDRYLAKWNEYLLLARGAQDVTTQYGIGLVTESDSAGGDAGVGMRWRDCGGDDLLRADHLGVVDWGGRGIRVWLRLSRLRWRAW